VQNLNGSRVNNGPLTGDSLGPQCCNKV
jgi:hypothetical protein